MDALAEAAGRRAREPTDAEAADRSRRSGLARLSRPADPRLAAPGLAHARRQGWCARADGGAARRASSPTVIVHTFHGHVLTGYFPPLISAAFTALERMFARYHDVPVAVSEEVRSDLVRLGVAPRRADRRASPRLRLLPLRAPAGGTPRAAGGVPPGASESRSTRRWSRLWRALSRSSVSIASCACESDRESRRRPGSSSLVTAPCVRSSRKLARSRRDSVNASRVGRLCVTTCRTSTSPVTSSRSRPTTKEPP